MIALQILLAALKIIGIILLALFCLIIILLLVILFVPIRYLAKGSYHNKEPKLSAKVTWLLSFVYVGFELGRKHPLIIKICGFKIVGKDKTKKDKTKKDKTIKDKNKKDKIDKDSFSNADTVDSTDVEPAVENVKEEIVKEEIAKEEIAKEESVKEDSSTAKTEAEESISEENSSSKEKEEEPKQKFYDKIKKYVDVVQSDCFKDAFEVCKDKLGKLLKHILPRKWKINGSISLKDPASTAKIFEISSVLYPWLYKHIHISTDFEDEHIDVYGYAKGRITVFTVLLLCALVYFNKNIKKLIKLFREG